MLEPGDESFKGVVLEDRNDNLLVRDTNSNYTRVLFKPDLNKDGVDENDEQKIQSFKVGANDYQRIIFANGRELEVKSSSGRTSGTFSVMPINNGSRGAEEYKVDWRTGGSISYNAAETMIKDYLRKRSR